jgi:hypothetical protein
MKILGIDPGPETSGVVLWSGSTVDFVQSECENLALERYLSTLDYDEAVIEDVVFYSLPVETVQEDGSTTKHFSGVGKSTFDTCKEIGRLSALLELHRKVYLLIPRPQIIRTLLGKQSGASTGILNARVRELLGEKGTKKAPGPLYGMSGNHAWSALALIAAYLELQKGA